MFLNANDVTVKIVNAKGKQGPVNDLLKNFLEYVMTNKPVDDFTEDVERQVWAVKNDKKAREEYMVLQAKIREHEIVAYEAGEAQGHAAGLAEGMAAGEAQGELKERLKNVKAVMEKMEVNAYEAMNILEIPLEEQQKLLPLL